ncbi:MAG: hypothetical protein EZS26_002101 [Candidatus Ordinivivax streblomastigis]|uniref:DUF5683 domain-containing protein n=1 Tax=Candidatus Ordinivivax streblomastigis TaxID=2540710 RepID=A0A5M8P083_9BACT|nr:MAG: hypothetical protein EZS26_002101 [Candidatus Ordinivivax streblomastigis]
MKCFLSVLGIAVLFSSCATLVHERYYPLAVSADQPETQIIYNEKKYSTPTEITVCRSDEPLQLTVVHDSIQKELLIPSRLSYMYWFGNLFWLSYAAPIGWLVELDSPKSRTYGREVIIHPLDSVSYTVKYPFLKSIKAKPTNKGDLNILFSLPEINPFYLHSFNNSIKESVGFPGIGAGFEYYYANNKALQLRADVIHMGSLFPYGYWFDYFSDWENSEDWTGQKTVNRSNTYNFSLTNTWQNRRFTIGCGINYALNEWNERLYHWSNQWEEKLENYIQQLDNEELRSQKNHSLGFVFNTYYRLTNHFYVGVIYRPSVYCFSPSPQFRYEHIISVDLAWKISLKK